MISFRTPFNNKQILVAMKTKLGITAILIAIISACAVGYAQQNQTVTFVYDSDGNRIVREILFGREEGNDRRGEQGEELLPKATDHFETLEVNLYPNPTSDKFYVETKGGTDRKIEATLTHVSGTILETRNMTASLETFDLSGLPPGTYLLRLTVEDETHVWKVIKKQ